MIFPNDYAWLESYLTSDSLWFEDVLNWEESFDLILSDVTLYSMFSASFFYSNQLFTDAFVKFSFLDILVLLETDKTQFSRELYDAFIWDTLTSLNTQFLPVQFFFYSDYQDLTAIFLYYSPDLIAVLHDFVLTYWIGNAFTQTPAAAFDIFSDLLNSSITEFVEHLLLFFTFIWIMIFFLNVFQITRLDNPTEAYMSRLLLYFYTLSREARIQVEAMLQVLFLFVFYWTMMVATFDDDQEELIEVFDTSCFYFFCLLIGYLVYKYSIHYFSFLEATDTGGRSTSFVAKQFFRDFMGTIGLFLRFFILLFRLNVYDNLDDFYDSYYIFVGDFDDDEYFSELFFSYHSLFFYASDANDDGLYSLEDESEFSSDLFYLYFLVWAKFFTFLLFILEEILRIALAFYISYLITFEVHSANCSYCEDDFFYQQRSRTRL